MLRMYRSHKVVEAELMTMNVAIGKGLVRGHSEKLDNDIEGYFVKYSDSYQSWSPRDEFDKGYSVLSSYYDIGEAKKRMEDGKRVMRKGWNGKNMYIFIVPSSEFVVNRPPLDQFNKEGTLIKYQAHVDMKTVDDSIVPWVCNQTDLLANDYMDYKEPSNNSDTEEHN